MKGKRDVYDFWTRFVGSALLVTVIGTTAAPPTSAQTTAAPPDATSLAARIQARIARFRGTVSLFAKNLDTGETFGLGADDRVRTASVIKVPIMVEAFAQAAEGKVKWTDELVVTREKQVAGAGVLQELSPGLRLSLRDAVTLMIIVSDNTATNLVLDVVTTDAVNARMEKLGFREIRSLRKIGGGGEAKARTVGDNVTKGIGVATPREMVLLLEKLENGEVVGQEDSRAMIELLKRQQYHDGIGRRLKDAAVASKPGALDRLRSDVGVVYSKGGRIALAITCDDIPETDYGVDAPGHLMLSDLSELLLDGLARKSSRP
jgi:beta-lactamase class A